MKENTGLWWVSTHITHPCANRISNFPGKNTVSTDFPSRKPFRNNSQFSTSTPIRKPIGKVHRRLQHMHTYAQVLVRYTWSGVPKLALPLDRVQNQRTCYFCNLFTLGYRSDGRVAGGTQADAIYGRVEKREEGKGETFLRWQPLLDFSIAIRSIAVRNRRFRVFRTKFFHSELWNRVLFEFLILYPSIGIRCLSWRDWGRKKGRFLRGDCFQKGKFRLLVSVSDDILSRWRVRDESNLNSLKYVWIWLNDILRLNCWLELIQI